MENTFMNYKNIYFDIGHFLKVKGFLRRQEDFTERVAGKKGELLVYSRNKDEKHGNIILSRDSNGSAGKVTYNRYHSLANELQGQIEKISKSSEDIRF